MVVMLEKTGGGGDSQRRLVRFLLVFWDQQWIEAVLVRSKVSELMPKGNFGLSTGRQYLFGGACLSVGGVDAGGVGDRRGDVGHVSLNRIGAGCERSVGGYVKFM